LPADVDAFAALAARHGLTTIEDAAHCVEGIAAGRKIGTTADYTCFSFYATKNLTTGEGGMVTTASAEGAERIRIASLHGMTRDAWARYQRPGRVAYDVVTPGFKYNMTDLQAALGLHQLRAIERHYARRQEICARYDEAFADLPIGRFVDPPAGTRHARHLYTVLIDACPASLVASSEAPGAARDAVADALSQAGISTSVHFPPLHLTKYYAERFGYRRGQYPYAERLTDTLLSLPLSPAHTDEQIAAVTRAVRGIYRVSSR
jgi:dTDP-4-amino-4,6-dideoxygalactose transaminase